MLIRVLVVAFAVLLFHADGLEAQRGARRTWVIPHVLEKQGRVLTSPNTFDTDLHLVSLDQRATLEVRVYGDTGQPLLSRTNQPVCNPCTITFQSGPKQVFSLEERISAAGGFLREVVTGYAVLTSTGPGEVNMQGFITNSHTSAFDVSVFGFEPQPISVPAQ